MNAAYAQLLYLALPEIIVVIAALVALAVDRLVARHWVLRKRFRTISLFGALGCAASFAWIVQHPVSASLFDGVFFASPLTAFVQGTLLVLTAFALFLAADAEFTDHVGEFVLLVLLATVGGMFLVASHDILVIFIALELLSLSLYVITGFDKRSPRSAEAALKYFLFGGMSAAFLLFGLSLMYGLTNTTSLAQMAASLHTLSPLAAIALVMLLIGFGFKVAAAPLHFWAPDVYQSGPTPAVALIASASKVASFVALFQILTIGFSGVAGSAAWHHVAAGWAPAVAALAVFSMVIGNLAALAQTSVRRLLAYSAIAHSGYMLIAVVARNQQSLSALLYYVATYGLATIGAFAVVDVVERSQGSDHLSAFAGLSRRAPLLAVSLMIFFLSAAGIPPLSGFFAKFYLFVAALQSPGLLWMVALAIAMSAVSLFYYLQVLKQALVVKVAEHTPALAVPVFTQVTIGLLAALVLWLGCAPQLLLRWIDVAVHAPGL